MLDELADEGRRDVLTLGVTPVLAAQLDDPGCLAGHRDLGRACGRRARPSSPAADRPALRELASREFRAGAQAAPVAGDPLARTAARPVLRSLADAGVVELLGGPATHPFLPLLDERVGRFALRGRAGRRAGAVRRGSPAGIWAPECGYSPGLERVYAGAGVSHFLADEATLAAGGRADVRAPGRCAAADVAVFGRDLSVTDRIWSSRTGYPTGRGVPGLPRHRPRQRAAPVPGHRRRRAVRRQGAVRAGPRGGRRRAGRAGLRRPGPGPAARRWPTATDGPAWSSPPTTPSCSGTGGTRGRRSWRRVLRLLPEAGVRLTTLRGALADGAVRGDVELPAGSWGAGKDFRVWDGPAGADRWWTRGSGCSAGCWTSSTTRRGAGRLLVRRPDLDQLARQALLALSSDWAFMVTRDQAADYAWRRADEHRAAFHRLAELVERRDPAAADGGRRQRATDGPFGDLDARTLAAQGV